MSYCAGCAAFATGVHDLDWSHLAACDEAASLSAISPTSALLLHASGRLHRPQLRFKVIIEGTLALRCTSPHAFEALTCGTMPHWDDTSKKIDWILLPLGEQVSRARRAPHPSAGLLTLPLHAGDASQLQ